LLDGTVTLPLILARRRDRQLPELDSSMTPDRAEALADRIAATGALEQVRERALAEVEAAKLILGEVDLPRRRLSALRLVADAVVDRYA
jgi:octaprenyl-diphosphate synthase